MSIDSLLARLTSRIKHDIDDKKIRKEFIYVPGSSKVYAILPPWNGRFRSSLILGKNIQKRGQSCATYQFPCEILSSDVEKTRKYFEEIRKEVSSDMEKLKKEYNFREVGLIGASLGCVNAAMISRNNPLINKVILVAPGHCLAESLWEGLRTQQLRKEYEIKGIKLEQLKDIWKELAPENNLEGMQSKDVSVYLSRADKIIPYYCGAKLIEVMKKEGISHKLKINNHMGHFGTLLNYYFFPKNI